MIDMAGKTFGRLTVQGLAPGRKWGQFLWACRCSCGKAVVVPGRDLRTGHSKSCGCFKSERMREIHIKHGYARGSGKVAPEYRIWVGIITRCTNPKATSYPRYGGQGVTICDAWRNDFTVFYAELGPRPTPQHSIDRIDGHRGYESGNCRWATPKEQTANRRRRKDSRPCPSI